MSEIKYIQHAGKPGDQVEVEKVGEKPASDKIKFVQHLPEYDKPEVPKKIEVPNLFEFMK